MDDQMTWILTDFKAGRKNFSETIDAIELLYARKLGLITPREVQKELDRIKALSQSPKKEG